MGNGLSVTEYDCAGCGIRVVRKPTKGQRPKWCTACRLRGVRHSGICISCGSNFLASIAGTKTCSRKCQASVFNKAKPKPPKVYQDRRSEIRRAFEDGDHETFMVCVIANCDTQGDCWNWQGRLSDGYPVLTWSGRQVSVHRLVLEAKHGAPLGSQHAHHICANTACVNPDHLQPVTHRENAAEMLARRSYLSRIAELEDALAALDPHHPLLTFIAVA